MSGFRSTYPRAIAIARYVEETPDQASLFDPLDPVFLGTGTATNNGGALSTTIGPGATTLGGVFGPTAVGHLASAQSLGGSAFGRSATASGAAAVSIGWFSTASAEDACAFGGSSLASATDSLAVGNGAQSTALGAITVGADTQALGALSIAIGLGAVANNWVLNTSSPLSIATHATAVVAAAPSNPASSRLRIRLNSVNYTIPLSIDE